jgi:hypothetical protein
MPMATVRQIGVAMVAEIDVAMQAPALEPHTPTLQGQDTEALLREVERRLARAGCADDSLDELAAEIAKRIRLMRDRRREKQMCSECAKQPTRARGLCLGCYQRARRNGRIS